MAFLLGETSQLFETNSKSHLLSHTNVLYVSNGKGKDACSMRGSGLLDDDDDACLVLAVLIHALGKFSCCESIHRHEFEIKIVPNAIKGLTYELPFSSFKSSLL